MLKKFIGIKGVGTFRNSASVGDTQFRRLTLIHAENGRGKTTLCAILRSLQNNDSNLIVERKTLDSEDAPHVSIQFDGGINEFKNGSWGSTIQHIEIFDATFVAQNVYSGNLITHDHKKNLCRVVIGAEGVLLSTKFDDLDAKVKVLNTAVNAARAVVEAAMPNGVAFEDYLGWGVDVDVDKNIAAKKAEIALVADGEAIRVKQPLAPMELPQPPSNLSEILKKTVNGVSAHAETRVDDRVFKRDRATHGCRSAVCPTMADPPFVTLDSGKGEL